MKNIAANSMPMIQVLRLNIFDLAGEELDEDVGDKAERNTI